MSFEIGDACLGPSGQSYVLERIEPCQNRRSGRKSFILFWRSACRRCGESFLARSGPTAKGASVHCEKHRLSRAECIAIARAVMVENARKRRQLKSLL